MKKSDIYKYALSSVIIDIASEIKNGECDDERAYAIVGELCERIDMEIKSEPIMKREAEGLHE